MAFPYFFMAGVMLVMALINTLLPGSLMGFRKNKNFFKTNPLAKRYLQNCNITMVVAAALFIAAYLFVVNPLNTKGWDISILFLLVFLTTFPMRKYGARLKELEKEEQILS